MRALLRLRAVLPDGSARLRTLREERPSGAGSAPGIAGANRFTLYEYFITDKIGHAQDRDAARRVLPLLARFIRALLGKLDLERSTVILTSDHGNIEDLSVRNHTLNPVPTIVWGRHRSRIAPRIRSLADITPAIVDVLTKGFETNGELDNTGRAFAQN